MSTHSTCDYSMMYPSAGTSALKPVHLVRMDVVAGGLSKDTNTRPFHHVQLQQDHTVAVRTSHTAQSPSATHSQRAFAWITGAFLVFMLMFGWLLSDKLVAAKRAQAISATEKATFVVSSGDSLWSIAEDHGIAGYETADVVSWIKDANELSSATLQPGEMLVVPA